MDRVVSGGQTMDPSTDDILCGGAGGAGQVPSLCCPTTSSIIMAAEQAGRLADREVCVLPSRAPSRRGWRRCSAFEQADAAAGAQISTLMTQAMAKVGDGADHLCRAGLRL